MDWYAGDAEAAWINGESRLVSSTPSSVFFTLSICHNCLREEEQSNQKMLLWFLGLGIAVALFGFLYLDSKVLGFLCGGATLIILAFLIINVLTRGKPKSALSVLQQHTNNVERSQELVGKNSNFFLWNEHTGLRFMARRRNAPKLVNIPAVRPIIAELPPGERALGVVGGEDWAKGHVLTNRRLMRFGFVLGNEWPLESVVAPFIVDSMTGTKFTVGILLKENWQIISLESKLNRECVYAFFSSLAGAVGWSILTPDTHPAPADSAFVVASETACVINGYFTGVNWPHMCSVCGTSEVFKKISVSEWQKVSVAKLLTLGPLLSTIFSGRFDANIPYCKTCHATSLELPGVVPLLVRLGGKDAVFFRNRGYGEKFLSVNGLMP